MQHNAHQTTEAKHTYTW